jgi:micrococcal nuclease
LKRRLVPAATGAAAICLALIALGPTATSSVPAGENLRGTVIAVYDGDTVRVRPEGHKAETVRLIGVDSPELDDSREPVRLMAFLAKRFTFGRLYQQKVELLPGPEARDGYGRLLAFVRTGDGEIFNVALVREGYAYAFLKFPFDEGLRKELKAAETQAREAGQGLWRKEPYPVIAAAEAGRRVGEIVAVEFHCLRSVRRGGFQVLEAEGEAFEAVIPIEIYRSLAGRLDFAGRTVEATGLVELYKGRPQIMIGVASQLETVARR